MPTILVRRSPPLVQIDGQHIENLSALEFELLCYLYEHSGQPCTKDELIEHVYRQKHDRMRGGVTDEALQTLVSRLRAKIEPAPKRPRYVVTIRGQGYKFVEPPAPTAPTATAPHGAGTSGRRDYKSYPPPQTLPSRYRLPYRDYIVDEYVGTRHQAYERLLSSRNVVCIWGPPGIGKTWVGARLALAWEVQDQDLAAKPQRPAFWFECRTGMGLYDLAYGLAEYLHGQGEASLWQMLHKDPDWTQRPTVLIDHMVERLDRAAYLLCLDDFDHVEQDPHVVLLLETLEKKLPRTASKVLLLARQKPAIPMIGSRELPPIRPDEIPELVLKLEVYHKDWLNPAVAQKFARRLIELVGVNLALLNVAAIEWFRNNTSRAEAEAYLDALDEGRIAHMVLECQDPLQSELLFALAILEDPAEVATVSKLARVSKKQVRAALDVLGSARLVLYDGGRYRLHASVRDICRHRLAAQRERFVALHQRAGDLFSQADDRYLQAAHHYLQAQAFGHMVRTLYEHSLELIAAGQAAPAQRFLGQAENALEGRQDLLDRQQWLWIYILRSDLDAWLGRLPEAQAAAEMGLEDLDDTGRFPYEAARLRARLGAILGKMYRLDQAIAHLNESRSAIRAAVRRASSVAEKTRHRYILLHILDSLALAHYANTSYDDAITCLEELLKYAYAIGGAPRAAFFAARAQVRLGQVYNDIGEPAKALAQAQAALRGFERLEHRWGVSFAQTELGRIHFNRGDYEQARSLYQDSLDTARELHDQEIMVNCHLVLGEIELVHPEALSERDLPAAATHFAAVERIARGRPERGQQAPTGPVPLPPFLAGFLEAGRLWAQGLQQLQAGQDEGRASLEQAREVLIQFGYHDDAALIQEALER